MNTEVVIKEGIKGFICPPGKRLCPGLILSFLPASGSAPYSARLGPVAAQAEGMAGPAVPESVWCLSLPDNLDIKRVSPTQYGRTLRLPMTTALYETLGKTTVGNSIRIFNSFSKFYTLFREEEKLQVLLLCHSVIKQE